MASAAAHKNKRLTQTALVLCNIVLLVGVITAAVMYSRLVDV
ncbi:hypothetical protein [Gemmiger sp.]